MPLDQHLYTKNTVTDVLDSYIKELLDSNEISNIIHANKLVSYRNLIQDEEFLESLHTFFYEISKLLETKHPNLHFYIEGRRKSLLSVERKINRYISMDRSLDTIKDLFAFRIVLFGDEKILDLIKHCYDVIEEIVNSAATKGFYPCDRLPLDGVKDLTTHHNEYFSTFKYKKYIKDYICFPKENGYQSIHLVLVDTKGRHLEIQVRTLEMHANAELGKSEHGIYKSLKYQNNAIDLDRTKISVQGYYNSLIDFSGVEKALQVFQEQR